MPVGAASHNQADGTAGSGRGGKDGGPVSRGIEGGGLGARSRAVRALDRLQVPEEVILIALGLAVGLAAGLAALVFRWGISTTAQAVSAARAAAPTAWIRALVVVLAPALGGLAVGLIGRYVAPEAQGGGIPEVMEAVALRGGRIRRRVALAKTVASALTLGSGGSAGTEGPIAHIGAGIGSSVGRLFGLSDERTRNLVACGAAGGIAATFNAPIAGVLFSLEVILGEFSARYLGTVVVSSVTAAAVASLFLGSRPAFAVPSCAPAGPGELPLYALLGLMAAPVAVGLSRALGWATDVFARVPVPRWLKPALGGLAVGVIGLALPPVLGVGYGVIETALHGGIAGPLMLALLAGKLLATALTLGSGGSGGIFAPSLYLGAMLGGLFGTAVHALWPQATAPVGAYALVGMAAVFSSAARTPVMAVVIVFEMTGDYRMVMPLLLATIVGTLLSQRLDADSIYAATLARRGIRLRQGRDLDLLEGIPVREAMSTSVTAAEANWPAARMWQALVTSGQNALPVTDAAGRLQGIVTARDLEAAAERLKDRPATAADAAVTEVLVAHPDEPVSEALRRMGGRDLGQLPVVAEHDDGRLLGLLSREDIIRAYNRAALARIDHAGGPLTQLQHLPGAAVHVMSVEDGCAAQGRTLAELKLPEGCVLALVMRDERPLIPRGDLQLLCGDRVTAVCRPGTAEAVARAFAGKER